MQRAASVLVLVLATLASGVARADYQAEAEIAKQIAIGTVNRARRAIAIGPHAGGFGGTALSPSDSFGGITFGLGLYVFDVPTILDLQELIRARLEVRVKERVAAIIAGGGAAPADLEAIAREVAADVKAELLGEVLAPRLLERPKLGVVVEGVRLMSPGGWQVRAGASLGLKVASLGIGAGIQFAGGLITPILGGELSVRLTPMGRLRTPVFDLYTRYDVGFEGGERNQTLVFGTRVLLDVL